MSNFQQFDDSVDNKAESSQRQNIELQDTNKEQNVNPIISNNNLSQALNTGSLSSVPVSSYLSKYHIGIFRDSRWDELLFNIQQNKIGIWVLRILIPSSAALFYSLLIMTYNSYIKNGNKEEYFRFQDDYTSLDAYEYCTEHLCDISLYAGCPGQPFSIFSTGITILVFLLLPIMEVRIANWRIIFQAQQTFLEQRQQQQNNSNFYLYNAVEADQINRKLGQVRKMRIFAYIAIFFLLPMAWIKFYESIFHFFSACVTFSFLYTCQFYDANFYKFMIYINEKQESKAYFGQYIYFMWVIIFGITSFMLWILVSSIFEYVAACLPFIYFFPFIWQYMQQVEEVIALNKILQK